MFAAPQLAGAARAVEVQEEFEGSGFGQDIGIHCSGDGVIKTFSRNARLYKGCRVINCKHEEDITLYYHCRIACSLRDRAVLREVGHEQEERLEEVEFRHDAKRVTDGDVVVCSLVFD